MFSGHWEAESWRLAHRLSSTARSGPRKRQLTKTRQRLVLKFLPLARAWAKPFKKEWRWSREEFDSAAYLALVEAAVAYDPIRGVRFGAFAQSRIRGAMVDLANHLIHTYRTNGSADERFYHLIESPDPKGRVMLSTEDEPVGSKVEAEEFVERWLDKLPARHAQACREIYVKGKTQNEAAEVLGCSKSKISVIHREAIDLIRDSWNTRVAGIERRSDQRFD